jgi:hypothetical protein
MKYKSLIIPSIFWLHTENHVQKSDDLKNKIPLTFGNPKSVYFRSFNFAFCRNIARKKKAHTALSAATRALPYSF